MKKIVKRIVVCLLVLSITLSSGLFNTLVAFATDSAYSIDKDSVGVKFSKQTYFQTDGGLSELPHTFEAVIKMPSGFGTARAGCIFSNFHSSADAAISFELANGGHPRLYFKNDSGTGVVDITFSDVVVTDDTLDEFIDGYFHLAITLDDSTKTAKCFVNGELKQSKTYANTYSNLNITLANLPFGAENGAFRIGNDFRVGNAQYFKGTIKTVAVYSGVKNSFSCDKISLSNDLICAYDLSDIANLGNDISNNNNDCSFAGYSTFAMDDMYFVKKRLQAKPKTFEATIKMPSALPIGEHLTESESNTVARGGVIIGNYKSANEASLNFEVTNKGEPRLFYIDATTQTMLKTVTKTITFSSAASNLLKDEWLHVAVTLDTGTGMAKCYINGVLTETKSGFTTDYHQNFNLNEFIVGNDYRAIHNFKGAIKNITMYSDVRTADEILADKSGVSLTDANLIAAIQSSKLGKTFVDVSGNGYNAEYSTVWMKSKPAVTDYAYSIAVVGDTQIANMYDVRNGTTIMKDTYKWIADNAQSKKIVQVLGLGDITESSSSPAVSNERQKEWDNAKTSITQLDGIVGYSLIRGNHDTIDDFTTTFGSYQNYTSQFDGFYLGDILNSYKLFSAGVDDYVLITLDYGASDAALSWASDICSMYPNRRVIITTHSYLFRDGTTLASGDVCEPAASTDKESSFNTVTRDYNNGDDYWNALISKHSNIFMVLSGHDPSIDVVCSQVKGENGNTIIQMLVDPQGIDNKKPLQGNTEGPFGLVTMLYFSADGKQIDVETYSTRYDAYHMATNQFTIDIPCNNHSFVNMVEDEKYLKERANCLHGNIYYKSCECGEFLPSNETFDDGNLGDCVYDRNVADDKYFAEEKNCEHGVMYYKSCVCGKAGTETFEVGDGSHDYVYSTTVAPNWSQKQDGYEIWVCSSNSEHVLHKNTIKWDTLSAKVQVVNGTIDGNDVVTVEKGTTVIAVADEIEGKKFVGWRMNGDVVSTDKEFSLVATNSITFITACYEDVAIVSPDEPSDEGSSDSNSSAMGCQMFTSTNEGGFVLMATAIVVAGGVIVTKRRRHVSK